MHHQVTGAGPPDVPIDAVGSGRHSDDADNVIPAIWEVHGGTVGRATVLCAKPPAQRVEKRRVLYI